MATANPAPDKAKITERALALGFDAIGFASAGDLDGVGDRLAAFIAAGYHGDMGWLSDTAARRGAPARLWPDARTVIMVAQNYGPDSDPLENLAHGERGTISVYARHRDYHRLIKGRLKQLGGWLAGNYGGDLKVFVDTAPVMEKPLAQAAGLGWQGKHTNLVSREYGSWLFLGAVMTTLEISSDAPETGHCGACRRCLDICPTDAFPAPYQLDARRCISYLTIEHKGHIPVEFRRAMGNRIYGCDDCLAVCPWNKFARTTTEPGLIARAELTTPKLAALAAMDDAGFRAFFSGSPIKRIGRDRFIRNVLIAIANSDDPALVPSVKTHLDDPNPLVRAMAVWALRQLLPDQEFDTLRGSEAREEQDTAVLTEWQGRETA